MSICDGCSVLSLILYDYSHVVMKCYPMTWLLVNTWFMVGNSSDLIVHDQAFRYCGFSKGGEFSAEKTKLCHKIIKAVCYDSQGPAKAFI